VSSFAFCVLCKENFLPKATKKTIILKTKTESVKLLLFQVIKIWRKKNWNCYFFRWWEFEGKKTEIVTFSGDENLIGEHSYKYLTVDEMKSLGDDSMPIDVTHDEKNHGTPQVSYNFTNFDLVVLLSQIFLTLIWSHELWFSHFIQSTLTSFVLIILIMSFKSS
jgi:hypothetical protein